ncbi:glycosyltransferase family 2 protein [Yoonia vestfoldensis]|uniref:glycosyltransferase family 2 protein n=1 Tax=Yoonia vestfoldensis TaxID=245188 RepID=UPI0003817B96|nr:glycosyltransferase family 2 protein [Yoonia vestfoldensis]
MRVSIIIPTYNRPGLLQRAVASALVACPADGEVVVIDDRSDTAETALRDITDPRLRITTNTGDKGAAGARNHGIAQSTGEIVMFLDDDDVMVADYPARVIAAARESVADFGFSGFAVVEGVCRSSEDWKLSNSLSAESGIVGTRVPLLLRMPGFGVGFWIKRTVFDRIGQIRTDQIVDEDGDYFCRLYGQGCKAWFEAEPGNIIMRDYGLSREHAPQLTRSVRPSLEADCHIRTLQRNQHYFGLRSEERWALIRRCLRFAAFHGVDRTAQTLIRDLTPLDWRIRAWLFWQMKKRGKHIHQRRVARKKARS